MAYGWVTRLGIGVLATLALSPALMAANDTAPEAALKAAFIFNFTKFVDWPGGESLERFNLCTSGTSMTAEALGAFEGKSALGRPIRIVRGVQVGAVRHCQLLFIAEPWQAGHLELLNEARNAAILTVSDAPGFVEGGGIIGLLREGGRLRFEINQEIANSRGLRVGAQLLRLAKSVR